MTFYAMGAICCGRPKFGIAYITYVACLCNLMKIWHNDDKDHDKLVVADQMIIQWNRHYRYSVSWAYWLSYNVTQSIIIQKTLALLSMGASRREDLSISTFYMTVFCVILIWSWKTWLSLWNGVPAMAKVQNVDSSSLIQHVFFHPNSLERALHGNTVMIYYYWAPVMPYKLEIYWISHWRSPSRVFSSNISLMNVHWMGMLSQNRSRPYPMYLASSSTQ